MFLFLLCLIAFFFLKKRFFDSTDYKFIIANGGVVIDVRSSGEFFGGHIENSLNIPLIDLPDKLDLLKDKNQSIITCCASVMRSAGAAKLLYSKGFANLVNGGGWSILENKLK